MFIVPMVLVLMHEMKIKLERGRSTNDDGIIIRYAILTFIVFTGLYW